MGKTRPEPIDGLPYRRISLSCGEYAERIWVITVSDRCPGSPFMDMMRSEEMQEIGIHRGAGLAGQLNIESVDAKGQWLGTGGI